MIALSLVFLAPLVVMVLGSLQRPLQPPPDGLDLWPDPAEWSNYLAVPRFMPLAWLLLNSLLLVVVAVPVTVVVTSMAGLAIVTARGRLRRGLIGVSVFMLLVPAAALWVPRVVLLRGVGLADTPLTVALLALAGTTPFYVLLFALAYSRIPVSLLEAATLEGLSPYAVWRRVALPLGRPAAVAVAALSTLYYWSTFMDPLTLVSSPGNWPVALGLRRLSEMEAALYPIYLAGAVIVTAPALLAFAIGQRSFFASVERS
ncbi:multiple sugar transport system permease protein [Actinokineospora alba]|uniref:Multiple sugar transport system permease protein n=1 Tax=Actinokineospora alba TaxID=504798 RepID=A0A1H0FYE7_9PSEU|nr:carbohydrate ABC transporter permease [Actinokineospora alba]TDP69678.1 multiple sugar transport system permease protein [Actinokineospora alba]SDI11391.1 multiple sugar transport system permease protein [Actinokineospora alba]SDN99584.1 multiple sugar transport system permease protein [Actinokineospora alba]